MTEPLRLDWGHVVLTPSGDEIRLPSWAMTQLRRLGVLVRDRRLGLFAIDPVIYQLMQSEFDPLTDGLRPILGVDIAGPDSVVCACLACRRKWDLMLHEIEQMMMFRSDMAIQRLCRREPAA